MPSTTKEASILVVDDAPESLEIARRQLEAADYMVFTAPGVAEALAVLEAVPVDLVLTDYRMPAVSGLELVRHVRQNLQGTEVIMITGYASVGGAIEAIKTGAEEYLSKPFTEEELLTAVRRALAKRNDRRVANGAQGTEGVVTEGIIGDSPAMQNVFRMIRKTAQTTATVLISGESGTGKELVARAIHYSSAQASRPFVPVNCGGIPEGLMESELFGHAKGAFTGATHSRPGFFITADGGSIFLDEISELSPHLQVKLLRVLQDKEVFMVGTTQPRHVHVRIVAATNRDLLSMVKRGAFRQDLYFRLNVISLEVPPLRERESDLLILARHFAEQFASDLGREPPVFSDGVLAALRDYHWPGNVRELENVVQRLVVMAEGDRIDVPELPAVMRFSTPRGETGQRTLAEVEAEHIRGVLASVGGNKTRASRILGIDCKTLRQKLKHMAASEDAASAGEKHPGGA